jgi:hypothetical protein
MRRVTNAVLLLPILAVGGCAVGIARVRAPERLPAEGLPALARRVTFDVCAPSREALAGRIREALARAGVQAELVAGPGLPADFTVTLRERRYEHGWSMALSMLTFSIVPGYLAERHDVEAHVGLERLVYERGVDGYLWAPFIFRPDFIGSVNGGWESARYKGMYEGMGAGFDETIQRLADDLRARLGREVAAAPSSEAAGVTCPGRQLLEAPGSRQ